MFVTVYGRRSCGACHVTRRHLDQAGIPYEYVDLDAPGGTRRFLEDAPAGRQATTLPVVVHEAGWWSGYRPDSIDALT